MLIGCTQKTGSQELSGLTSEQVSSMIKNGETSKGEILAQFGNRYEVDEDAQGLEKWTYKLTARELKASAFVPLVNLFTNIVEDNMHTLIVTFDENDVVIRHRFDNHMIERTRSELRQESIK